MTDYLRDPETNELLIVNGDFVRGESTRQHQKNLLLANKGAYKQSPEIGVGLIDFLNDDDPGEMMREIRLQFAADGMIVESLGFGSDGKLQINASYGN